MSRYAQGSNLSNDSPVTGGSELGGLFFKIFLLRIELNVQICFRKPMFTTPPSWEWCGGQTTQTFFHRNSMKGPELHINLMSCNTTPMEQGDGVEGTIHEMEINGMSRTTQNSSFFLFPHLHREFQPSLLKFFCWRCPELHRNLIVCNVLSMRKGIGPYH